MSKLRWKSLIFVFFLALLYLPQVGAEPCGEDFPCHRALIKYSKKIPLPQAEKILAKQGIAVLKHFKHSGILYLALPESEDTMGVINSLRGQAGVLLASPDYRVHAHVLPNDTRFGELWGLHNTGQAGGSIGNDIGMDEVWDQFTDSSSVVVGVVDSGIDYDHPDLAANVWVNAGEIPGNGVDDDNNGYVDDVHGYDFENNDGDPWDDDGHGTHVSGTIGAVGNNGIGVAGINWQIQIMALKFLDETGNGLISNGIEAIEYGIDNGADILNNSWGTPFPVSGLTSAVGATDAAGLVFVASAGNDSDNTDTGFRSNYPSAYSTPNIISVAAIDRFDQLADFSNYGEVTVDLGAPGVDVLSTVPTWYFSGSNDYGYGSGTSMASPHVAGAAALLWAAFPELTHREVIDLIYLGVVPKDYLNGMVSTGGTLNLANSYDIGMNGLPNTPPVANAGADQNKEVGDLVTLNGSAFDADGDSPLFFSWSLQVPNGSSAGLNDASIANPSFTADLEGTYVATLIVNDGEDDSQPDSVTITVELPPPPPEPEPDPPPTAIIEAYKITGDDQMVELGEGVTVTLGEEVRLDGSSSTSADPGQRQYQWIFLVQPLGSSAPLSGDDQAVASFFPDVAGTYTVQLTVDDGNGESSAEFSLLAVVESPSNPPAAPPAEEPVADDPGTGTPVSGEPESNDGGGDTTGSTQASSGCALSYSGKSGKGTALVWVLLMSIPWSFRSSSIYNTHRS